MVEFDGDEKSPKILLEIIICTKWDHKEEVKPSIVRYIAPHLRNNKNS